MKKIKNVFLLFIISCLVLNTACKKNTGATLKIDIKHLDSVEQVLLITDDINFAGGVQMIDTLEIINGKFEKKLSRLIQPALFYLKFENQPIKLNFFLEPGSTLTISSQDSTFENINIKGGNTQTDFLKYKTIIKPILQRFDSLSFILSLLQTKEQEVNIPDEIKTEFQNLQYQKFIIDSTFIKSNHNSVVSAWLIFANYTSGQISYKEAKGLLKDLSTSNQKSIFVEKLNKLIALHLPIGSDLLNFKAPSVDDKMLDFATEAKGNIVLLEFWASWCKPCRNNNPGLVKVYNNYAHKGFKIFAVSLDRDKDKWKKAISDDKLTWTHVSDLKEWDNEVANLYHVQQIPNNILFDKNGQIIAKDLSNEELEQTLSIVLK